MALIVRHIKTEFGTFNKFVNIRGGELNPSQSIHTGTRTSSLPKETVLIAAVLCVEEH